MVHVIERDTKLAQLVQSWSDVPEHIRKTIIALAQPYIKEKK